MEKKAFRPSMITPEKSSLEILPTEIWFERADHLAVNWLQVLQRLLRRPLLQLCVPTNLQRISRQFNRNRGHDAIVLQHTSLPG